MIRMLVPGEAKWRPMLCKPACAPCAAVSSIRALCQLPDRQGLKPQLLQLDLVPTRPITAIVLELDVAILFPFFFCRKLLREPL